MSDSESLSPDLSVTSAPTVALDTEVTDPPQRPRTLRKVDEREGDRYSVEGEIARGGSGRILRAFDRRLERPVAIKELLSDASPFAKRRFEREAILTSRLQHPSIIPVYDTGISAAGVPFFAMKLVEGRSLLQHLGGARDLRARLALVPIVLAVADGLAYAHGERILHRDLKPANILVGPFGETVIIDWGLAKDLNLRADTAEEDDLDEAIRSPAMTVAGAVMGTVGYMPPEQAMARAVDERADVYALGALLYHVLCGEPPVLAKTLHGYRAALERPAVAVGERAADVPRDLAAIIDKAIAHDPAARYPSAVELAADLRRFLDGQIVAAYRYSVKERLLRLVRRHRAAAAVAAVLVTLLVTSGVLSVSRILEERSRAEQQRAAAEDLVRYVLFDLRGRLDALGKLALLRGVGEHVSGYYDALERNVTLDPPARRLRAAALSVLSDVADAQGDPVRAARTRRSAIMLLDELRPLGNAEDVIAAVQDLDRQATQLREHGDLDPAVSTLDDGLARLGAAQARFPDNLDLVGRRAELLSARGRIEYMKHGEAAALASHGAALAIDLALLVSRPDDRRLLRQTSLVLGQLGAIASDRGDRDDGAGVYRTALGLAERLVAASPDDIEALSLRASNRMELGFTMSQGKQIAMLRASVEEWRGLSDRDPSNLAVKHSLVVALSLLGDALKVSGDRDGALAAHTQERTLLEQLIHDDPGHDNWLHGMTITDNKLGDLARGQQKWDEALGWYRRAAALRALLVAKEPSNLRRWSELATVEERIGATLNGVGRSEEALASFGAAAANRRRVLDSAPKDIEYMRGLSISEVGVGNSEQALGRPADARAAFLRSLELRRVMTAAMPDNLNYLNYMCEALGNVTEASLALHNLDAAEPTSTEALACRQRMVALAPTYPEMHAELVDSHLTVGDIARARDDTRRATEVYGTALTLAERVLSDNPKRADAQAALGEAHGRLGLLQAGTRDGARHLALAIEALAALEAKGKLSPPELARLAGYRAAAGARRP